MNFKIGKTISIIFLLISAKSFAAAYTVPPPNQSLIGHIQTTSAGYGDTVVTMAQRYDVGFNAMQKANPQLDMASGFTYGKTLKIPTQHLLPNLAREGIVVNLPEMRMYYYPTGTNQVFTYPIGIGKIGKTLPITRATITKKTVNPQWVPPDDIREFNLKQGIVLPQVMPAGPDNPLGPYAIYMSIPTFLIHSTIFPESVGKRASFGCVRMYESDIKSFFPSVNTGIPVVVINSPTKVAWQNNKLFIESHQPLEEHSANPDAGLPGMVHQINDIAKNQPTLVDWQAIAYIAKERDGLPHDVGIRISG